MIRYAINKDKLVEIVFFLLTIEPTGFKSFIIRHKNLGLENTKYNNLFNLKLNMINPEVNYDFIRKFKNMVLLPDHFLQL